MLKTLSSSQYPLHDKRLYKYSRGEVKIQFYQEKSLTTDGRVSMFSLLLFLSIIFKSDYQVNDLKIILSAGRYLVGFQH